MGETAFYRPSQIANRLGVGVMTVYGWIRSGQLQIAKRLPGGGLLIEAQELERFLNKNTKRTLTKRGKAANDKPGK